MSMTTMTTMTTTSPSSICSTHPATSTLSATGAITIGDEASTSAPNTDALEARSLRVALPVSRAASSSSDTSSGPSPTDIRRGDEPSNITAAGTRQSMTRAESYKRYLDAWQAARSFADHQGWDAQAAVDRATGRGFGDRLFPASLIRTPNEEKRQE